MMFQPDFDLYAGSHELPGEGSCAMEVAVLVAGFDWIQINTAGDLPECFCPSLGAFVIRLNDEMPDDARQSLKPFITRLVSTRDTREVCQARISYLLMHGAKLATMAALENCLFYNEAKLLSRCKNENDISINIEQIIKNLRGEYRSRNESSSFEMRTCVKILSQLVNIKHDLPLAGAKIGKIIGHSWYCHKNSDSAFDWKPYISALEGAIEIGRQAPQIEINDIKSRVKILEGAKP